MTLNCRSFDNQTNFPVQVRNLNNHDDDYDVPAKSFGKHDMWLSGVARPVLISIIPEDEKTRLLSLYDSDYGLYYKKMEEKNYEKQAVDGSKDFYIELTEDMLSIICENGTFDGTKETIEWRNWQEDFGYEIKEAKKRCDFSHVDDNRVSYPVGWIPWLAEWEEAVSRGDKYFAYNDPSNIDGVGVLIGNFNGTIFGSNLKNETCEDLPFYDPVLGHYSWVLAPEGDIIYKWIDKLSIEKDNYTLHSNLKPAKPVICAGEMTLTRSGLDDLYVELNDSSGQYEPDEGACIKYVVEELEKIRISTQNATYYSRTKP